MTRSRLAVLWIAALLLFTALLPLPSRADEEGIQLFLPDAQFKTNIIRAFITHDIPSTGNPVLILANIDDTDNIPANTDEKDNTSANTNEKDKSKNWKTHPITYARNQNWVEEINGQEVGFTGTLLLFDLHKYHIPFYKAMTRFTPVLSWTEKNTDNGPGDDRMAIGKRPVYMGNIYGVARWTLVIVISLVLLIVFMTRHHKNKAMQLFCGPRGYLSLSRVQVGAWTLVIGSVVLSYGLVGMEVPDIPDSLIALMGLSLATGGLNYISVDIKKSGDSTPPAPPMEGALHLKHLVCQPEEGTGELKPSLVKAQMVFWTGLLLVIFVMKSLIDGVMWDIPWEMVAMMGMSQAGYLSPKFIPQKDTPAAAKPATDTPAESQ